jgi:hypothetical protein
MRLIASLLSPLILRIARRLRFPQLFMLTAGLFVLDLLIPDLIPFLDEFVLGLATLLFGAWRAQKKEHQEEAQEDDQDVIITEARVVESDQATAKDRSSSHQ